jgi:hypothetical protein
MPNGWFSPPRNVSRTSGLPSLSASRKSVMRLAEAPVTVFDSFSPSFTSGLASFLGSVRASATSTSPLGSA